MKKDCPRCSNLADLSPANIFRPFCSEKCKLIDLGTWANEEKLISRPIESEDFYED
tara:strand:+ start:155 stop:322 length:168 start_codon:yes stop_codon:yes gene_type:complete